MTADLRAAEASNSDAREQSHALRLQQLMAGAEVVLGSIDNQLYLTPDRDGIRQTWPLKSTAIRELALDEYATRHGMVPPDRAWDAVVSILSARARTSAVKVPVGYRVMRGPSGAVWVDLANERWEAVRITASGWSIEVPDEVRFVRYNATRPLPTPVRGGAVDALRPLLNLDEVEYALVVGFLLACLRPEPPYPLLCLYGEQGSGKSTATRLVRSVVDPSSAPERSMPRGGSSERDLYIAAGHSWVLAFGNLSNLRADVSDALCRLTDGGEFATRLLYSNNDEQVFDLARPVIVNGIEAVVGRPDLLDRSLVIELPRIAAGEHVSRDELELKVATALPGVLGALFDGVSAALRATPSLPGKPVTRLVDVERWVAASEAGLGWEGTRFRHALESNKARRIEAALDGSVLLRVVVEFLRSRPANSPIWEGTMTHLLAELVGYGELDIRPSTAGSELLRIEPVLRQIGYDVTRRRTSGGTERLSRFDARPVTADTSVTPRE